MKKVTNLLIIIFMFSGLLRLSAQEGISVNEYRLSIYTSDYKTSKQLLERFLQQNSFKIENQQEAKFSHSFEFEVKAFQIPLVDSLVAKLGYISSKHLNSYNNAKKLAEKKLELEYKLAEKQEYEKMQHKIDSVSSKMYYEHWNKTRGIDEAIYKLQLLIKQLESVSELYNVEITLNDEQISPANNRVSFINMPGVSYTYMMVENPLKGISYETYQGISLKYLFTKGKSYFSFGALKAIDKDNLDSTAYHEYFNFAFGQDFYSRHFGRGSNKFLNLYVGYQVGMGIANSPKRTLGIPFVIPGIGLELFKNKYILLDVRGDYFLPINKQNQNIRAWQFTSSLNFVF
jgi:hypothetical protein